MGASEEELIYSVIRQPWAPDSRAPTPAGLFSCHAETQFQVVTSFVDHPSAVHLSVLYAAVRLVAVSPAAVRQIVYRFSLWPVEMPRGPVLRDHEEFVQALQPSRDRPVRTPPRRNGGPWMPFRDARQLSDVLL